jgi:hypothetical protein
MDAGLDAPPDAPLDGGPDAEPPEEPPPLPGRCRTTPDIAPFTDPVLEYEWPSSEVVHRSAIHVCSTPLVIDLAPDGVELRPKIVFVSYPAISRTIIGGYLRIVDPRTDTTISYPPLEGQNGVLEGTGNLAAGDLDGDGRSEIVGLGTGSGTYAFRYDGTLMWESPYPTATDRGLWDPSIGGGPTLADLEGDGTIEVIAGRNVLEGIDGAHRWTGDDTTARAINQFLGPIACAADLDGDGEQEVIAGYTAFRADGRIYWNSTSQRDGLCAVADVYPEHAGPEVVLSSWGSVRVLNGRTGELIWMRRLEGRVGISVGGAPTVADFDGDGDVEFGVAHGSVYGVYDPSCEGPGDGCVGEDVLWLDRETSDASSSGTGSSVFDFNGDGAAEVVYNDEHYFRVYDGATGMELFQHPSSSRTRSENPTIADVDNDGDAEIIFSSNSEAFFLRDWWTDPGVEVWGDRRGRWVGARRIWNQHAYHITNVEEDGTIPSPETDSWTVLNAYRQNLREDGDVLATPDLWGGRAEWECTGPGMARIRVNVANWGLERAGAGVIVRLYRGRPEAGVLVGEAVTTRTLEPGGDRETVTFTLMVGAAPEDYWATLDSPDDLDGGFVAECREDNNEVLAWHVSC